MSPDAYTLNVHTHTHTQTNRADYFGGLVNLAARVMASAHFGQVLITSGPTTIEAAEQDWNDVKNLDWDESNCATTTIFAGSPSQGLPSSHDSDDASFSGAYDWASDGEVVHLRGVGYYELKGIDYKGRPLPQLLISVTSDKLRAREACIAKKQPLSKGKTIFIADPDNTPERPADYDALQRALSKRRSRRFKKINSGGLSRRIEKEEVDVGSFRDSLTRLGEMLSFGSQLQYLRSLSPPGETKSSEGTGNGEDDDARPAPGE